MAVHNKGAENQRSQAEQAPQQQNTGTQQASSRGRSFGTRQFRKSKVGEVLLQLNETFNRLKADMPVDGIEVELVPIDNQSMGMHYSLAVLCALTEIGNDRVVSYYGMILEGSNSRPSPEIKNMHGVDVEIKLTAMDAWDELTLGKVTDVLKNRYGEAVLINADATVVPAEFDPTDRDAVGDLLWNANEATISALETSYPDAFAHVSIDRIIDRTRERAIARFSYNDGDAESIVGLPVRSDIRLNISTEELRNNKQFNGFQHNNSADLMEVNSHVDLVYAPDIAQPQQIGQPPITQQFIPRIVINRITSLGDVPYTPETFFLGLASLRLISQNYAWVGAFNDFHNNKLRDVGSLGYRLKLGEGGKSDKIDTGSNQFGLQDLNELMMYAVHSEPAFSIDCEEAGPESWLTSMFIYLAQGDGQAYQYIVEALNRLTNGAFNRHWQGGQIIVDENNHIHLGTFTDQEHGTRDLREIDSLAVLTALGHNDLASADLFESTINDGTAPLEMRLDKRWQIIKNIVPSANLRGFARRLTFTPDFLNALTAAVVEAGLQLDAEGLQTAVAQNHQVGNMNLQQYVVSGGNVGGMMNQGNQSAGAFNFRPNRASRW
tara:strand:- start:3208 stop:5025 length:1818 start_codon:yes stop_codon:yes gene_type:complete